MLQPLCLLQIRYQVWCSFGHTFNTREKSNAPFFSVQIPPLKSWDPFIGGPFYLFFIPNLIQVDSNCCGVSCFCCIQSCGTWKRSSVGWYRYLETWVSMIWSFNPCGEKIWGLVTLQVPYKLLQKHIPCAPKTLTKVGLNVLHNILYFKNPRYNLSIFPLYRRFEVPTFLFLILPGLYYLPLLIFIEVYLYLFTL